MCSSIIMTFLPKDRKTMNWCFIIGPEEKMFEILQGDNRFPICRQCVAWYRRAQMLHLASTCLGGESVTVLHAGRPDKNWLETHAHCRIWQNKTCDKGAGIHWYSIDICMRSANNFLTGRGDVSILYSWCRLQFTDDNLSYLLVVSYQDNTNSVSRNQ